ncbi:MAG TPA: hypothetical protein VGO58_11430 [Chitinophagaceae bacterium]|jgi:hypothetical protein|nr:hypothetical protein [Chitinophagaceae bacterium]
MLRTAFITIFFFLALIKANAQKIKAALNTIAAKFPEKKSCLHYGYYVAGEMIWFKEYLYSKGLSGLLPADRFGRLQVRPVSDAAYSPIKLSL